MTAARTMPTKTAPMTNTCGLIPIPASAASRAKPPSMSLQPLGTHTNTAATTKIAEIAAEMKKPRLIDDIPDRSEGRGDTVKMPITAVITPMAGITSGRTRPNSPNAALPRINAATNTTA